MVDDQTLIGKARSALQPRRVSRFVEAGGVASALDSTLGNVFLGVCIDTACRMGFCAERAAVASMIAACCVAEPARQGRAWVAMPYRFLGPVRRVHHEGERPIGIDWELETPMPAAILTRARVAVA